LLQSVRVKENFWPQYGRNIWNIYLIYLWTFFLHIYCWVPLCRPVYDTRFSA